MKLDGLKKYHFVGIGGVGMSALAKILIELGCQVSGSDAKDSPTLDMLKKLGAKIFVGHKAKNILDDKGMPEMKMVASLGEREADMRIIRNDPYLTRTRYNVVQGQNMYIHKGQRVNFVLLEPLRIKIFNRDDI